MSNKSELWNEDSFALVPREVIPIPNMSKVEMKIDDNQHAKLDNSYESGSARYGNFINYYGFHPAENRVRLFPNYARYVQCERKIVCLDIGCNTGELTQALHKDLLTSSIASEERPTIETCSILAVDLDNTLIDRAKILNQNQDIQFSCVNVLSDDFDLLIKPYLAKHKKQMFDVVYCFSITMWIHINHGDEGLKTFLRKISEISDLLVIEPQPWKCYGKAVRRLKRANSEPFSEFGNLKIKKDVESYIMNCLVKEGNFIKILDSAPTSWGRQIYFYKKSAT